MEEDDLLALRTFAREEQEIHDQSIQEVDPNFSSSDDESFGARCFVPLRILAHIASQS